MAGKAKFDQESAFRSIVGGGKQEGADAPDGAARKKDEKINRVQRSYYLDRDIEKALRKKALEDDKNLTETINEVLRQGLENYL